MATKINTPLLSIVIANYNYGRFLEEAIRSILSQGMGDKVEIIICDAASTDNSVEIIQKYAGDLPSNTERDSAVHLSPTPTPISWWCSEKDGGQSEAFNKGFSHANGEWLTWLNADEIYLPGTLVKFAQTAAKLKHAEWITGNLLKFDDSSRKITYVSWGPHCVPGWFRYNRATTDVFGPSTFFKKSLYEKMGPIDETLHFAMDTEYWTRLTMAGVKQYRLNHICWAFREHGESKTGGVQSSETKEKRSKEREYWQRKLGYSYRGSFANPWYVFWLICRILDGSLLIRFVKRAQLIGQTLDATLEVLQ